MEEGTAPSRSLPNSHQDVWETYAASIYKLCLKKCGNAEDARDFFQEIYLKFHKNAALVANHPEPFFWFARVIENHKNSVLRKELSRRRLMNEALACAEPPGAYSVRGNFAGIEELIEGYGFNEYEKMLIVFKAAGFSVKELSDILGVSVSALRRKFAKISQRLAGDFGVDLH